jgi:uncharacterized cofD-like protein
VAIGGGTGLSTLLSGLRPYVFEGHSSAISSPCIRELHAVTTVSDDGGSSGRLRKELNISPPGDVRNCLVALSGTDSLLSQLFQYRFPRGTGLAGHSLGNLFLAALSSITGDFAEAVRLSSELLQVSGRVIPATATAVELEALLEDGSMLRGETRIAASPVRIRRLFLRPSEPEPLPETLAAIARADLITIGPGSLFTSLVPNLLVRGISDAIARSQALKVYVCNLMTQANESLQLTAADHIRVLHDHAGAKLFDVVLLNRAPLSSLNGGHPVENDVDKIAQLGVAVRFGDYLDDSNGIRHARAALARDLLSLAQNSPLYHLSREL